jgi:hypothetical protein
MVWTADDLVAAVRVRAQLPASAGDGAMTDADILTLADEEIALRLVPLVRRSRGDYFVSTHDVDIVSGTGSYRVPSRAQTSGLRELTIVDSSGREWPVPQMHLEDAGPAQIYGGGWDAVRFYMRGPDVVLVPTPTYPDCTLRMYYHRSHSELVPNADTGTVQWGGGGDNDCSLSAFPAAWSSLTFGFTADLYYQNPPFGIQAMSASVTNVTGDVATIYQVATLGMTAGALYGIAYAHKTSVVDLPRECWPLLVSALTARVCEVIGDRDAAALAYGLYDRESANIMTLLAPRVEGNKQVIVDRFSTLRSGRGGGWGWR